MRSCREARIANPRYRVGVTSDNQLCKFVIRGSAINIDHTTNVVTFYPLIF